jgi:RpiR family carbohydrate utilization transcriptional regulator
MAASMMRPNDVAVVISNTGRTRSIIQIASAARGCGAKVIGVTGSESPLAAECDVALIVETHDNTNIFTPTISRIAALIVIDVLSTVVALRRGEEHQERFREMKRRLNDLRFEGEPQGLRAPVASARASAGEGRRLRPSVMEVKDHR